MSAKKKIAPDFDQLLGESDVKLDRVAVGGPQPDGPSPSGDISEAEPAPRAEEPAEPRVEAPAEPVPAAGNESTTAPAASKKQNVLAEYTVQMPSRNKPAPVYDYDRIENFDNIEGTYIQTNVKLHPGVRISYSQAVRIRKSQGGRFTGRQFVHEALNEKFLKMAPFNEYTQRLHDEAETEFARKPGDRSGETAEQWRPPVKE